LHLTSLSAFPSSSWLPCPGLKAARPQSTASDYPRHTTFLDIVIPRANKLRPPSFLQNKVRIFVGSLGRISSTSPSGIQRRRTWKSSAHRREVVLDPILLHPAKRRVGHDHVHPLLRRLRAHKGKTRQNLAALVSKRLHKARSLRHRADLSHQTRIAAEGELNPLILSDTKSDTVKKRRKSVSG